MNFDPNQKTQNKLTSKLLIEHALAKCSLQKEVALTIGAEPTRVSEWKKQKSRMPTDVANKIIDVYGSPVSAKGQYVSNAKLIANSSDLVEYLIKNHNFQISRLMQPLIQSLTWAYFPNRENHDSVTIVDIKIHDFINDKRVIGHATQLVKSWTLQERHWTDCDEFKLKFEDIDCIRNIKGQKSTIRALITEFGLDEEFKELTIAQHNYLLDLDKLSVVIYICAAIRRTADLTECLLTSWNNNTRPYTDKDTTSELVVSGEVFVNEDYRDKEVLVFDKNKNSKRIYENELISFLKQLSTWQKKTTGKIPLHLSNDTPRHYFDKRQSELFTKVDRLQVIYDRSRSCFTVSLTVASIDAINERYRNIPSSLVMTDISTHELLDDVIPTLHSLHSSSVAIDWAISDVGTKGKLARMGVMIPGVIVI